MWECHLLSLSKLKPSLWYSNLTWWSKGEENTDEGVDGHGCKCRSLWAVGCLAPRYSTCIGKCLGDTQMCFWAQIVYRSIESNTVEPFETDKPEFVLMQWKIQWLHTSDALAYWQRHHTTPKIQITIQCTLQLVYETHIWTEDWSIEFQVHSSWHTRWILTQS